MFLSVIHHIQFSYFEFSVILYSGARILNAHIKTHLYVHKAYHINYNTHHRTSQPRNVHVLFDSEEIRLKECYAARKVCKCVQQPITPTIAFYIFPKYFLHRIYLSMWKDLCSCNYSLKDENHFFADRKRNSFCVDK